MWIDRDNRSIELRSIPGIPDCYRAGSDGKIYSFYGVNANAGKDMPCALAGSIGAQGYHLCYLYIEGHRVTKATHVLVCLAFHGPKPSPKAQVRHLDGESTNTTPGNLCWGSQSENEADKVTHGRAIRGARHHSARLTEPDILVIRQGAETGRRICDLAAEYGVDESSIRGIVKRTRWAHVV